MTKLDHSHESHNVNCRFCGAIHSVNWACISDISQVIHNVNKRKIVQTNIIFFVSYGDGILTIIEAFAEHDCCSEPIGMFSEQKHNISFAQFFFIIIV